MAKFPRPPDQGSYSLDFPDEVVRHPVPGGKPRQRKDFAGSWATTPARFTVNGAEYSAIAAFYAATENGALPFSIDLFVSNGTALTEHEAVFDAPLRLASQSGDTFVVETVMSVNPEPLT